MDGLCPQCIHNKVLRARLVEIRPHVSEGRCDNHPSRKGIPIENVAERRKSAIPRRSEEHTSELQSLMRISYAVFCLKKKITRSTELTLQLINKATNSTQIDNNSLKHA